ncbi:lactonase family protein [Devosia albogilva]|uniref:Lactonase family protein n=1 Tax=Devosia albogilva TaxID=429726 RepID=A0ABW5QP26_9HYPH
MSLFVFVGSQNRTDTEIREGGGLQVFSYDEGTADLRLLHAEAGADNPSYIAIDQPGGALYAVNEVGSWLECTVSAYGIDWTSGALTYLNRQPTRGRASCHVALLPGHRLGVANYSHEDGGPDQAVCFYPLSADGSIDAPFASAPHKPEAGHEPRDRSHAHCVSLTLDGRLVLVTDLGLDCVFAYDAADPAREVQRVRLPAGHGPRHVVGHPGGRFIYVLNELVPFISVLEWDGSILRHHSDVGTLENLEPGAAAYGAAIQLSSDARFLYASTRGVDCISVFEVNSDGSRLERVQVAGCGGAWPRDFCLTPGGKHVLVANQHSNSVAILSRDGESGQLTDTGHRLDIGTPQCVKIVQAS